MRIVTVSRQVGSYGDEIADMVAVKLGLKLIGRTELHELARSCDLEYSNICASYETEHGPGFFERLFLDKPAYKSLYEALTFEQAAEENVVIMGRGAHIILRGIPGVFKLLVVAPEEIRVKRIMAERNIQEEAAEEFARTKDEHREKLISSVFGKDPKDWSLFDMILNTSIFSPEAGSKVITEAVEAMERAADKQDLKEQMKNTAVAKRIEALIRKKLAAHSASQVQVTPVTPGVMRITGRIPEQKEKKRIEELVIEYPGVTMVENELRVTELSFPY